MRSEGRLRSLCIKWVNHLPHDASRVFLVYVCNQLDPCSGIDPSSIVGLRQLNTNHIRHHLVDFYVWQPDETDFL